MDEEMCLCAVGAGSSAPSWIGATYLEHESRIHVKSFEGIKFYCICHGVRCKRMADFPDWLARGRGALGAEPAVAPALIISRRVEVHRTAAAIFTIFRVIKTRVCVCQSAH